IYISFHQYYVLMPNVRVN
ncbi:hypothetical protein NPIL_407391, partial [Nephila pilipes]